MSRLGAGFGGGAGVLLGAIGSAYLSEALRAKRKHADYAVLYGAVIGGAVGAAVGAGADCAKPSGTVSGPPRQLQARFP